MSNDLKAYAKTLDRVHNITQSIISRLTDLTITLDELSDISKNILVVEQSTPLYPETINKPVEPASTKTRKKKKLDLDAKPETEPEPEPEPETTPGDE